MAGAADSDGGVVGLRRWYRIASVSKELMKQLEEILSIVGIKATVRAYWSRKNNRQPLHYIDVPIKEVKRFSLKLSL